MVENVFGNTFNLHKTYVTENRKTEGGRERAREAGREGWLQGGRETERQTDRMIG